MSLSQSDVFLLCHFTPKRVPISIISKWAGHYDSSFTMKTYVDASDDDLKQGRQALAKIHRIVEIL